MEVEREGVTGGIYTLLLDSLRCKMLFWTRILLGGLVLFFSFLFFSSHFYFTFSVKQMTDTALFLDNFKHLFSFYTYILLVAFLYPDSLIPCYSSEEFLTLLFVSVGISCYSLYVWQGLTIFFFLKGTRGCELTFITNSWIIAFPTEYFLCSFSYFIPVALRVLMAICLLLQM